MDISDTGSSLGMSLGAEIVYGTHEDSHVVMSEKVQSLAGSIYQEFERMIARYDEDVVKTLMPLLVNVLECLDASYQQNQEHDVELELLREDNEQLVTQYEREKGARKTAEQKLLEYEDAAEGERKELSSRLEALESIVRMLELKHKNSMEHASRLEEREAELKKEYAKLHESVNICKKMFKVTCTKCNNECELQEKEGDVCGILCNSCNEAFCNNCVNVSLKEAQTVARSGGSLLFFCAACKPHVKDLRQNIIKFQREHQEKEFYIIELQANHQDKLDELRNEIKNLTTDNKEKESHLARLKRGFKDFEESVYLAEQNFVDKISEQRRDIKCVNKELLQMVAQNTQLTSELTNLKSDYEILRVDYNQLLDFKNDMLVSIEQLTLKKKDYADDLKHANYQLLKERNNRLSSEIRQLETNCQQHGTYYNQLLNFKTDMIKRIKSISTENEVYVDGLKERSQQLGQVMEQQETNDKQLSEDDEVYVNDDSNQSKRYTELFKTHVDYMERTKLLHSSHQLVNERVEAGRLNSNLLNNGRSSGPISFGFASLENAETVDSVPSSPISSTHSSPSLHSEMDNINSKQAVLKVERAQETDSVNLENKSMVTSPVSPPGSQTNNNGGGSRVHTRTEKRSANTLYQELSFQDGDGDEDASDITGGWVHPGEYASSVNDNFYGMGKEVENLIMENNELMATKNALNVVKDDLIVKVDELTGEIDMLREEILSLSVSRTKLRERITELEEELRKVKDANQAKQDADEEADVPLAQRKRFTRMEMARVLMERNQYKESFMELQEAVRWTQMIRASREPNLDKHSHSNKSIWRFFQNLFSGGDRVQRNMVVPHLRYQTATNQVTPGLKALPRIQDRGEVEMGSEKFMMRKALERREQYRQVRAHVKKDDGRLHAYGWSLPGKGSTSDTSEKQGNSVHVPVPVYCRPLAETTPNMRIWCAAGVNLMGGYTKDGGLMVGGSVFYSDEPKIPESKSTTQVESLEKELDDDKEGALLETKLSSLVWIVTTTSQASIVTVIDANNPAELLNSFGVCSAQVLCIASVPGASPSDYVDTPIEIPTEEPTPQDAKDTTADSTASPVKTDDSSGDTENIPHNPIKKTPSQNSLEAAALGKITFIEKNETAVNRRDKYKTLIASKESSTDVEDKELEKSPEEAGSDEQKEPEAKEPENKSPTKADETSDSPTGSVTQEIMSSVLATMWLGDENGNVCVHSSVANWAQRLHSVKLKDAVISIVHVDGRVVIALANGQIAVFKRNSEGEWDLSQYYIVQIGLPHLSVRHLAVVADKVWCGYRNKIHVLQPRELKIVHTLEAHPRRESPVRQMAWLGDGVWVSIRLDSTLRLYHARTYQHLQDVDIEPYISKMLGTGKLGFSLVRITSLLISSNRLWIGTDNGVIISVPLNDNNQGSGHHKMYVMTDTGLTKVPTPRKYLSMVPYCTMAHAQLSFHGHRDNVKFFVAVPGNGGVSAASTPSEAMSASATSVGSPQKQQHSSMLVISGGEGYVDFRVGDEMEDSIIGDASRLAWNQNKNEGELSHLIVWQVSI